MGSIGGMFQSVTGFPPPHVIHISRILSTLNAHYSETNPTSTKGKRAYGCPSHGEKSLKKCLNRNTQTKYM